MPPWMFMWLLAVVIFVACKALTWFTTPVPAPRWKKIAYLIAWPGMDALAFLTQSAKRPTVAEWAFALSKFSIGLITLYIVVPRCGALDPYWIGWLGMIGIVMVLHFGAFHLLSCGWRSLGINAKPLMIWPLLSTSVSEFWGRRWNTAFRDLTHRYLFRPATKWFGLRTAVIVGFIASGIVHDLVISVPAGGGYGWPTLYFLISGVAMFIERSSWGRMIGLGEGVRGWLFTLIVLLAPATWLFHRPFVEVIVNPFLNAIGAYP